MDILKKTYSFQIDKDFGGYWVLAADLDNDGKAEIISVNTHRLVTKGIKSHYVISLVAHDIYGNILWSFGNPSSKKEKLGYDVPCQVYDIDNDGKLEVVFCSNSKFFVLEGDTGKVKNRHTLPSPIATDCIAFFEQSNKLSKELNILVKERYKKFWVYTHNWELQWTYQHPNNIHIGHHPEIFNTKTGDILFTGFMFITSSGEKICEVKSERYDIFKGHVDSCKVIKQGNDYRNWIFIVSTCKAKVLMMIDGNGKIIWEKYGKHFEKISIGQHNNEYIIVVDVKDEISKFSKELWFIDLNGHIINTICPNQKKSCHIHSLIKFNQKDAIAVANNNSIYDMCGKRIAIFDLPKDMNVNNIFQANLTKNESYYVLITENLEVHLYKGLTDHSDYELGTPKNYTLF